MKELNDKVDFLHAGMRESFLQTDTIIFDGDGQTFPIVSLHVFTIS